MKIEWNDDNEVRTDEGGNVWRKATDVEHYLRKLLAELVGGEDAPCRFDHHGYCQEHGWFGAPGECGTREAREAVGLDV